MSRGWLSISDRGTFSNTYNSFAPMIPPAIVARNRLPTSFSFSPFLLVSRVITQYPAMKQRAIITPNEDMEKFPILISSGYIR